MNKKKKKKKVSIVIMAGILMLSLTACSSTEKPQDAYVKAHESLNEIIAPEELDNVIGEINQLVNYRYSPFEINEDGYKYISSTTIKELNSRIQGFGDSEYFDVSDKYDEVYTSVVEYLESIGGQVQEDGSVIYPDGIKATVIKNEDTSEIESEVEVEDEEVGKSTEIIEETAAELPNEPGETESLETEEIVESTEETLESVEETAESEESEEMENLEESESEYTEEYVDNSDVVYLTGKPPVGTDEEGFPIDEDGNIVITETEAGDPRLDKIVDFSGNVLWEGCTEAKAPHLTNEQNRKYMRAVKTVNAAAFEIAKGQQSSFEEQRRINELEASFEDADDGLGRADNPIVFEDDIITHLNQMNTSSAVQEVDGKHVIEWYRVLDGYNKQTGRYEYNILDRTFYLDLATTYIPISAYKGDTEYNFSLMDYRLLDNGQLFLFYESRDVLGNLANALTVVGNVVNGQFVADNITDFTNFYSK